MILPLPIMVKIGNKSYWDILPLEIKELILLHRAAIIIQNYAICKFYKTYGIFWEDMVLNYQSIYDYYCWFNNIMDPPGDYIEYYR
jgi:hypothetical protein